MKMCEQVLKKDSAPIQFKLFELLKNQKKAKKSPSYRCAAINKMIQPNQPNLFAISSCFVWNDVCRDILCCSFAQKLPNQGNQGSLLPVLCVLLR